MVRRQRLTGCVRRRARRGYRAVAIRSSRNGIGMTRWCGGCVVAAVVGSARRGWRGRMSMAWRVAWIIHALIGISRRIGSITRVGGRIGTFWRLGTIAPSSVIASFGIAGTRRILGGSPSAAVPVDAVGHRPPGPHIGRDAELALESRSRRWRKLARVAVSSFSIGGSWAAGIVTSVARVSSTNCSTAADGRSGWEGRTGSATCDVWTSTVGLHVPFCRVIRHPAGWRGGSAQRWRWRRTTNAQFCLIDRIHGGG